MDTFTNREKKISKDFVKKGYHIFNIKEKKILDNICNKIIYKSSKILKKKLDKKFLYFTHDYIQDHQLNNYRLKIYDHINKDKNFLKSYYKMGKEYLDILCGNELAIQKKINLSIQLPKDNSSILPIHTDVWSGNSPFELVLWIPLVSVQNTKSMFILPPKTNNYYFNNLKKFQTTDNIFNHAKSKLNWLKLRYGQGLIFSQNLLHGNVKNEEKTTRWSFNCRFKSLFSPYDKKKFGEYFTSMNLRPSSILGINYEDPKI
ncbi:2OG-Fe(II) oxygenase [Candidatus Pelagibacter sp.]|nr:2OG-Fe(II) oxygenase [Candidatus Pelagibacter sp.]